MTDHHNSLSGLGWGADFERQLDLDEIGAFPPARVTAVHRARVSALAEAGALTLALPAGTSAGEIAVGDWVLYEPDTGRVLRLLDRKSLLHRRAAGVDSRDQLIAANVDTLFITTSFNDDFNPARLERFLALAHAAGVLPVFVLTRADLCDDPAPYLDRLRAIAPSVAVVTLDARDPSQAERLADWCRPGQTTAFVGSSGVGKSTLINALAGLELATQGIREDDAKGRHTTTGRRLYRLASGGWVIDTPGMRALRLAEVAEGIDAVFPEIAELAAGCRFSDCAHDLEPGCAVQAAIAAGAFDEDRLARWRKLREEDARNAESLAQSRARDRSFGKMIKTAKKTHRKG